jgi:Flp pilus assembly protein TadG
MLSGVRKNLAKIAADSGGNLIIEFAVAIPVLTLLVMGLVDLGRFSLQKSALLQGAREGAQYGSFQYSDSSGINSTAQNATGLSGVTATNIVFCECTSGVTVSCSTTCSGGGILKRYVTVTTTKPFSSVMSVTTLSFGSFGHWTPPTSSSASVTMICP